MKSKDYYQAQEGDARYYVYIHRRASDKKIFYVGKGKSTRAWETRLRNDYWKRVYSKHGFEVSIIFDDLEEHTAFTYEVDLIALLKYNGASLTNLTDGGEGCSGRKVTSAQRLKLSQSLKASQKLKEAAAKRVGISRPQSVIEALRIANTGRKHSEQSKSKMSESRKGVSPSNISKEKYTFHHMSGETFYGTRKEFSLHTEISNNTVAKLFTKTINGRTIIKNWSLSPIAIPGKRDRELVEETVRPASNRDKTIYTFYHISGEEFTGIRYDFQIFANITAREIGWLFCKTKSRRRSVLGWALSPHTWDDYHSSSKC